MAKKELTNLILNLFSKLGGNMNNVLGSRSNVTFLGKGKPPEGFIESDINIEAIGVLGKNKILDELESSMGYLTAGKLNDVQAGKLYENLLKVDEVFNPKQIPNITDMATGTRDLTQEGLGALRTRNRQMTDEEIRDFADEFGIDPTEDYYNFDGTLASAQKILKDSQDETAYMYQQYKAGRLDPQPGEKGRKEFLEKKLEEAELSGESKLMSRAEREELADLELLDDLPPPGSRGGPDDIAAPVQDAETTIRNLEAQDPELAAQFKKIMLSNQGATPTKRATAREFLVEALKEDDIAKGGNTFSDFVSKEDIKFITEGGGGIAGDPLVLVEKYFGPRIRELVPEGASSEELAIFTKRVLNNVVDAAGNRPDSPRFNRFTARFIDDESFAKGGRVGFQGGGMDASKDDFNTPSKTSTKTTKTTTTNDGGDDKVFPVTINPVYEKDDILPDYLPTKVGLEALLADKGKLKAVLDTEESLKEGELIGNVDFQGALNTLIGPVNFDAYADLDGQKAISANYNRGDLNLGGSFDAEGNKNLSFAYETPKGFQISADTDLGDNTMFKVKVPLGAKPNRSSKTFAKGGLAKILEV